MKKENNSNAKEIHVNLIEIFFQIDERISKLHEHSSDVFLQLNSYLKDYHKKSKIVADNASNIFNTIVGDEETNLVRDLDALLKKLRNFRKNSKLSNTEMNQVLSSLIEMVNLAIVQSRNFKQDLLTLGYLIANYKFVMNYKQTSSDNSDKQDDIKVSIDSWEKESKIIRKSIDVVEDDLCELRNRMLELKFKAESSGEYSLANIDDLCYGIDTTSHVISKKNKESQLSFPILKEKTKSSAESIGNIITHLQYHDIIRQKIEHVQSSHQTIVEGLQKDMSKISDSATQSEIIPNRQIADIVGLQAAQLIMVSKEYQNAIEVITDNFQRIANDIKEMSTLSSNFSFDESQSENTLLKNIKDKLDEAIILLDQSDTKRVSLDFLDSKENIRLITKKAETTIIDPLIKLGLDFPKDFKQHSNENHLGFQIENMVAEILEKNNNLKVNLSQITANSAELVKNLEDDEFGTDLEQERIKLMVKVSKILRSLDIDNSMLDTVLNQNSKLNSEILNKIESTINKVDYYMLFEDVLSDVINSLNKINSTIKPENAGDGPKDFGDLEELEKLYTVKSERIIHKNITGSPTVEDSSDEEEEDLELF